MKASRPLQLPVWPGKKPTNQPTVVTRGRGHPQLRQNQGWSNKQMVLNNNNPWKTNQWQHMLGFSMVLCFDIWVYSKLNVCLCAVFNIRSNRNSNIIATSQLEFIVTVVCSLFDITFQSRFGSFLWHLGGGHVGLTHELRMGTKNMKLDPKDDENPNLQLEISASEVQKILHDSKGGSSWTHFWFQNLRNIPPVWN